MRNVWFAVAMILAGGILLSACGKETGSVAGPEVKAVEAPVSGPASAGSTVTLSVSGMT